MKKTEFHLEQEGIIMIRSKSIPLVITLLAASLLLAACGGAAEEPAVAPTFDSIPLYTHAAETSPIPTVVCLSDEGTHRVNRAR
jgi:hypothetical protein